jgi:hypothetical protein
MEESNNILSKYSAKTGINDTFSINDLRDKEFAGIPLTKREKQALANFDAFRLSELNSIKDDMAFHKRYRELQVMANLGDYEEFLKEKYFI